jgi:hypothetical protein
MISDIHKDIKNKLQYFYSIKKIPNIIFHGSSGSGKRTIVQDFINTIYDNDKNKIKFFVMYVNCAQGKGIKFIREELKFFAKTHIYSNGGDIFKSIVLLNADKLTMDAQSALRRCIELFCHSTRFFIVVEDKYKLLKPILSRFCEIYIPEPNIEKESINLYKYNLENTFKLKEFKEARLETLKKMIAKAGVIKNGDVEKYKELTIKIYENGYSGLDLIKLTENPGNFKFLVDEKRYELLVSFNKIKNEFRNEKILILFILNFLFLDLKFSLENISFF